MIKAIPKADPVHAWPVSYLISAKEAPHLAEPELIDVLPRFSLVEGALHYNTSDGDTLAIPEDLIVVHDVKADRILSYSTERFHETYDVL